MTLPLMPKATAVWLIEKTALTFTQIADFCGMHPLEVQAIADGEVAQGIVGYDPVPTASSRPRRSAAREADPELPAAAADRPADAEAAARRRATPRWPSATTGRTPSPSCCATTRSSREAQVAKLLGTTKDTIQKVRERTHWNSANIKPRDPVILGLCSQTDLNAAIARRTSGWSGRAAPSRRRRCRTRTRSPDRAVRRRSAAVLAPEPLHLLLDPQLLDLQPRERLAVGPGSLVLVGDAQFQRGMAFLQGIETGLQGHWTPPLSVSRGWHGNPIDTVMLLRPRRAMVMAAVGRMHPSLHFPWY